MAQISLNSLMGTATPTYPEQVAAPFRQELTESGFEQLLTPEDVDKALNKKDGKVTLVVLNSVCGCAARAARPGVLLSLFNEVVPDNLVTVFAGMEKEAVNYFRENFLLGITPTSPNIALFKDGELIEILQRHQIEGKSAGAIADELVGLYNGSCNKKNSEEEVASMRSRFINRFNVDPLGA
ncbi:MAG: BrxA/BrxB family bacilliredoxin [Ginsengibacter sp.]